MKYRNLMMLAVAATLAASAVVQAQPFNERGEDFIAAAPLGSPLPRSAVVAELNGYNERGEDFIAAAPLGSSLPRSAVVAELNGYNERGADIVFQVREQKVMLEPLPRLAQTDCMAVCAIE